MASRLDRAMKDAGFESQSALSRASGVPQPTINRILKGVGKNGPETHTLARLAATCNVVFRWLHEGVEPQSRITHTQSIAHESTKPVSDRIEHLSPATQQLISQIIAAAEQGISSPQLIEALTKVLHVALPTTALPDCPKFSDELTKRQP